MKVLMKKTMSLLTSLALCSIVSPFLTGNSLKTSAAEPLEAAYDTIVAKYREAFESNFTDYDSNVVDSEIPIFLSDSEFCYAYKDIDGNGTPELIIGRSPESYFLDFNYLIGTKQIFCIYAFDGDKSVKLFDHNFSFAILGSSDCLIGSDGMLYKYNSNDVGYKYMTYYRLSGNGYDLEFVERLSYEGKYYRSVSEGVQRGDEITQEEFEQIQMSYQEAYGKRSGVENVEWNSLGSVPPVSETTTETVTSTTETTSTTTVTTKKDSGSTTVKTNAPKTGDTGLFEAVFGLISAAGISIILRKNTDTN